MKRIFRVVWVTMFSLLVLGSTRSFADPGKSGSSQGSNKSQGSSGGIIGFIDGLIQDIFGDSGGSNNKGGSPTPNSIGTPPYVGNGGGGTAPIDGGLSLLLVAGVGLGVKKAIGRKGKANTASY